MSRIVFCIIAAAGMLCSCTGADDSTPRRRGYPRLPLYDSCYARVDGAALHLEANCGADVTTDSAGRWITVRYPLYDAALYVTVTPAATAEALQAAIDNRRERIRLNLGGREATTSHISSDGGFEAALVEAPGAGMPLQFVATDGSGYVESGALQLNAASGSAYDSIRPVEAALRRDIVHTLSRLGFDD